MRVCEERGAKGVPHDAMFIASYYALFKLQYWSREFIVDECKQSMMTSLTIRLQDTFAHMSLSGARTSAALVTRHRTCC